MIALSGSGEPGRRLCLGGITVAFRFLVRAVGFEPTMSWLRTRWLRPLAVTPHNRIVGGDEGDRTLDLGTANAALSQLSYIPKELVLPAGLEPATPGFSARCSTN